MLWFEPKKINRSDRAIANLKDLIFMAGRIKLAICEFIVNYELRILHSSLTLSPFIIHNSSLKNSSLNTTSLR